MLQDWHKWLVVDFLLSLPNNFPFIIRTKVLRMDKMVGEQTRKMNHVIETAKDLRA